MFYHWHHQRFGNMIEEALCSLTVGYILPHRKYRGLTQSYIYGSESENDFVTLFLLGGSSRFAGCHGIWTQHDGPHLSGGKQPWAAVSEPESDRDSWQDFSAGGGGGHCRTVPYRQILLDEPPCRTEPRWGLYWERGQFLALAVSWLLNFLPWSHKGRTKYLPKNQSSNSNSQH